MRCARRYISPIPDFESVYRAHYEAVWRFIARRVPRADTDDVVAETFAVAWRRRHEIEADLTRAWLYGVARRQVANRLRQNRRRANLFSRAVGMGYGSVVDEPKLLEGIDRSSPLAAIWERLSTAEREVLLLHVWEELSSAELAVVLGVSEVAARQRLSRALHAARRIRLELGVGE